MEKEILKLKVGNLIALRTSIINTLIVLAGGIASLCFLSSSLLKFGLIMVGVFYFVTFISNLDSTMKEINKLLNSKEL